MDSISEKIASFANSLRYEDLAPRAAHHVKRRLLDTFGCALGGFYSEPAKIARRYATAQMGTPPARVLGIDALSSIEGAAFANTVMARYLDCNDTFLGAGGAHPSDMIPGVLAVTEAVGASGKDAILGITIAYEVLGSCLGAVNIRERGWDQGTFVGIGTAAGAGRLLGLTKEQMAHAISLSIIPNVPMRQTRAGELSMWKGAATAAAVRSGIFAALLAREGMTGPFEPFEGEHALWQQVTGPFELKPLGAPDQPLVVESVHFKYFPSEYHSQAPLGMVLDIREKVALDDIAALNIQTYHVAYSEIGREPQKWDPRTRETADHSLPYLVASALRDGTIDLHTFDTNKILDPSLRPLMNKVTVRENEEFTRHYSKKLMSEIEVVTTSGERKVWVADYPKGHANNPMSDAEVEVKFRTLCEDVLTPQQCRAAIEAVWAFDEARVVGPVLDAVRVTAGQHVR